MVNLIEIKENELIKAYKMHRQGFMPTFIKYHDRINPVFMPYSKFRKYFNRPNLTMFWIKSNGTEVGQIWIGVKDNRIRLARLFVLKKYQNQGIAQKAIRLAELMYPDYDTWCLDTIKQEQNNCHLYEKMGYTTTGEEKIISKRMTIINYEKRS